MSKRDPNVRAFLDKQVHIATEHFGQLDPLRFLEREDRRGDDRRLLLLVARRASEMDFLQVPVDALGDHGTSSRET